METFYEGDKGNIYGREMCNIDINNGNIINRLKLDIYTLEFRLKCFMIKHLRAKL